jgi:DNA excision repair protein ERCC-8
MDDAVGVIAPGLTSSPYQGRQPVSINARAHNGAVTGVRWTSNGSHLVTAGQDSRIRVWNATTGANTLTHFGPRVRNGMTSHVVERAPLILPVDVMFSGHETLLWPNFSDGQHDKGEIFMFELREGTFIKCLKVPGLISRSRQRQQRQRGRSTALTAARINALAWRGNGASGEGIEMFSAHGDGTIKAWASRVPEEVDETVETELDERKRKRDVLEEIYHSLTSPSVRFS